MDRDNLLAQKRQTLEEELQQWALEKGLLKKGERISFSLQVEGYPTASEDVLELYAMDFFSCVRLRKNARSSGHSDQLATRVRTRLDWRFNGRLITLREFLKEWTYEELKQIRKLGDSGVHLICVTLKESGLDLNGRPF